MDISRQVVHPAVQISLEPGEASLGSLDAGLRGSSGAHADFGEAFGLIPELAHGLFVEAAQGGPLVFDQALEILKAPGRIALKTRRDVVPVVQFCFELADGLRVTLARRGPLPHDVGASFGEKREVLFDRVWGLSGFSPLVKRGVEALEMRFEISQA
jgi:hypothetical protein